MKTGYRVATGAVAALSLGLAAAVFAHPGQMGGAMGPGMMGGMGHGGMGPGAMGGGPAGRMAAQQLMSPEEHTALQEKMRNAKTPEGRQRIAEANRAEMEKRAKEKGGALPGPHGPRAGFGPGSAAQTR